jgi:hypothetical protein
VSHEPDPDLPEPEFEYDPQVGTIDLTQAALNARAGRAGRRYALEALDAQIADSRSACASTTDGGGRRGA